MTKGYFNKQKSNRKSKCLKTTTKDFGNIICVKKPLNYIRLLSVSFSY